jgi:hypothetical protein
VKKEYVTFVSNLKDLVENKEVSMAVRDLTPGPRKYDCKIVKAVISKSAEKLPDGDILQIRSWTGVLHPELWRIQIIKELDETLPGRPHDETLKSLN